MKTILMIIGAIIGALIVRQGVAQTATETTKSNMQKVSFLAGEWTGGGWMITPDRKRVEFTQKEAIRFDLGGSVLYIRGEGFDPEGKQVHNALGIMYYDSSLKKFFMDAFLETGQRTHADMELIDGGLKWWFQTEQGGTVQYTINVKDGQWIEKGNYSPDGVTWFPFMEFSLTKK